MSFYGFSYTFRCNRRRVYFKNAFLVISENSIHNYHGKIKFLQSLLNLCSIIEASTRYFPDYSEHLIQEPLRAAASHFNL